MALYRCCLCGFEDTTLNDIRKHLVKDHNYKKKDQTIIDVFYRNRKLKSYDLVRKEIVI